MDTIVLNGEIWIEGNCVYVLPDKYQGARYGSLSRSHKTDYSVKFKKKIIAGYNIVGDGTPQAFIPILTGATEEELPLTR